MQSVSSRIWTRVAMSIADDDNHYTTKYVPLTLLQGFEKGYSSFACERELETKLKYFDPHSNGHQRCVFLVLLMLNRKPWTHSAGWSATSYQQLLRSPNSIGVPKAPSAWCGFPYHNSSINPSPTVTGTRTVLTSVLTELYNSSTPTRSPTRSLKSNV